MGIKVETYEDLENQLQAAIEAVNHALKDTPETDPEKGRLERAAKKLASLREEALKEPGGNKPKKRDKDYYAAEIASLGVTVSKPPVFMWDNC